MLVAKTGYDPQLRLEAFYTGGSPARITRDGKRLVCPCADEVKIVDLASGMVERTLAGDSEPITCVAASPDNATLASFSRSLTARVHDLRTGSLRRSWRPHRAPVADACVDASGGYVATASADRSVKVWDLDTGSLTHHLQGHGGVVLRVLFHPRRPLLFSADDQGEVRVWSLRAAAGGGGGGPRGGSGSSGGGGRCLAALSGHHLSAVTSLALAPDGWRLLSGSRDKTVHVWDLRRALEAVASSPAAAAAALSSGGKKRKNDDAASPAAANLVTKLSAIPVFEAVEGLVVLPAGSPFPGVAEADAAAQRQQAEAAAAAALAASPSAGASSAAQAPLPRPMVFATAGEKGVVRLWRTDTGKCVGTQAPPWTSSSSSSPASQGLVEAAPQNPAPAGHELTELALVPGARELCAASGDCRLLFLGPQQQQQQQEAEGVAATAAPPQPGLHLRRELVGNHDEVTDLRFVGDPSNPLHLAVATNGDVLRTFSLDAARGGSAAARCVGHRGAVLALDAARLGDGRDLLASGGRDCEVRAWDAETGACLAVGRGHIGAVAAVALSRRWPKQAAGSAAGSAAFLASAGADRLLKIWDLSPVAGSRGWQADRLLGGGRSGGKADDDDEQEEDEDDKETGGGGKSGKAAASAASAPPRRLRATAAVAAHDKDVNAVAVSPNDALVATASQDRTCKVWRLPSLSAVAVLRGHKRGVWGVQFSPVDQAVLTCSGDKTVKLWGIPGAASSSSGGLVAASCLRTFEGHGGGVLRTLFVTAGTQVVSAGADGLLKLWNVRGGGGGKGGGGRGGGNASSSTKGAGECVATMDGHTDRVWALCAAGGLGRDDLLASGGADAAVAVWRDATEQRARAGAEAAALLSQREQALGNALADGRLTEAARLALELRHPGRLLAVLRRAGSRRADAALGALARRAAAAARKESSGQGVSAAPGDDSDLRVLLSYAREWNTNARNCHAAQALMRQLLRELPPAQMVEALGGGAASAAAVAAAAAAAAGDDSDDDDDGGAKAAAARSAPPPVPARELVDGLLAYSERHFARVDRLLRATFLADLTLEAANVLLPSEAQQQEEEEEQEEREEQTRRRGAAAAAAAAAVGAAPANGSGAANGHHHHHPGAASPSLSLEMDDGDDGEEDEEEGGGAAGRRQRAGQGGGGGGGGDDDAQWKASGGDSEEDEEVDDAEEDDDDEPTPPPPPRARAAAAKPKKAPPPAGKRAAAAPPAAAAKRSRGPTNAVAPSTPAKRTSTRQRK